MLGLQHCRQATSHHPPDGTCRMLGEEVLRLAPPPFSNRDLEARYRQVQAIGLAKIDAQVFLTAGLLWLAGIAVVLVHDG